MEKDRQEKVKNNTNSFIEKIKYILSWTRKKIELNEMYFNQKTESLGKPYVSMGDIYHAYLGTNVGAEIDKGRPVLVFQGNDRYLRQSNLVFIIPISSNPRTGSYKVVIKVGDVIENIGIKDSTIMIQQARSISKNRLDEYKGKLSDEKLKEVSMELNKFLYKDTPLHMEGNAQTIQMDAAKSVNIL